MKTEVIDSFDALHRLLQDRGNRNYVFRGEDSDQYSLRSKFGRVAASEFAKDCDMNVGVAMERAMLDEFARRSCSLITHTPTNEWEWLALAQHVGMATRLLDWTTNPLVAAWFATSRMESLRDRVIYLLDADVVPDADLSVSPFVMQRLVLYRPRHTMARIGSQLGLFTVHPRPATPLRHRTLERWLIKANAVIDMHVTIEHYGIDEAFIFADLDGLARHMNHTFLGSAIYVL